MSWGLEPQERRHLLRGYQTLRLVGIAILASGLAWLVAAEGTQILLPVAAMALGAAVATTGVLWLARFETRRDPKTRRAVRLLVSGFGLKLFALPAVALGGGWIAWGGAPSLPLAIGLVVAALAAYVGGIRARIDGLSMLPSGSQYA